MTQMEISEQEYWKCAYKSAEALLGLLSVFEERNIQGVDKAIESLRSVVAGGDDFSKVKEPKQPQPQPQPQHIPSPSPPRQQHSHQAGKRPWHNYSTYDMEDDWYQVSPFHIEVPLSNNKVAVCLFVSTEQQLDEAIQEIKKAAYIAIDCEFQSVKKSLPELKLIQIGVSSTKGFAIQVDSVGLDVLSAKLKPILEDDGVNIVGWSYRPDAMAIESFFKSIEQAPVLDLQAKLMPIAVETMNLEAAMVKFAPQWDGLEAFRKAKHYSDGFFYKEDDCIWARNPLPPKALVYSVFDVLSVHALHQYTTQYPSDEKFYWPYTLSNQSEKALNRFHQQRAQGIASPANASASKNGKSPATPKTHWNNNYKSTSPTYRHRNKQRQEKEEEEYLARLSPQPETDDGYDDNDTRFQKDIQKAIILSVKESTRKEHQTYGGDSSASSSNQQQQQQDNVIVDDLDDYDRQSKTLMFARNEMASETPAAEVNYESWGDFDPTSQPFFGSQPFASPSVAAAQSASSDYDPPAVETSVPEFKPSPALAAATATASVPPVVSAPVPVRQPIPPPIGASPHFSQQKTHKSPQHQFSRPPTQNAYQNKSYSYQAASSTAQQYHSSQYQQQPQAQPPQAHHLPKPVPYAFRNNHNAARSPRKAFANVARASPQAPAQSHSAPPVVAPASSTASAKPPATAGFGSKPSKETYASKFQSRIAAGDQGGSFTWSQDAVNGVGAASWTSFANTTGRKWKSGIDSELTDFEKEEAKRKAAAAAAAAAGSASPVKKEAIKFNTTAGMVAGRRAQDPLNDGGDNWSREDERPDTMEMKMNQIPIRKHFSGPRTMGPDDADHSDSDDDNDENPYAFFDAGSSRRLSDMDGVGLKVKQSSEPQVARQHRPVDTLETFVDAIYPHSFEPNQELAMLTLTSFEHLDMIIVPDQPFTVTVCFHTVESKQKAFVLKALQLYLSTGESYTCVLEKACEIRNRPRFKSTVFGRLLSDPTIKRISWCPDFIMDCFVQILGFEMGPTVDLGEKVMENDAAMSLAIAVEKYLKDWPDLIEYLECKQHYDSLTNMSARKFGGSCWDRPKVPEEVLKFCAIQGLTVYALYQKTLELGFGADEDYIYPNDDDDDDE